MVFKANGREYFNDVIDSYSTIYDDVYSTCTCACPTVTRARCTTAHIVCVPTPTVVVLWPLRLQVKGSHVFWNTIVRDLVTHVIVDVPLL